MLQSVQLYLSESTVHSFVHLTGDRRPYIKLIWAVAFLLSAIYCSMRVAESCRKYQSGDVTTTVKANSLNFQFPDIYLCNENPISGSYSVNLNENDTKLLRRYRTMVNESLKDYRPVMLEDDLGTFAMRLVHSLPYRFLSDKMGHRWIEQNILYDYAFANKTVFYHPSLINCLKLSWSSDSRIELQSLSDPLILVLFLDPQLPPSIGPNDYSFVINAGGRKVVMHPFDLDLTIGADLMRSSGMRVYFVPKGQYPSDLETQIVIGPGFQHQFRLVMQDVIYDESDFAGQCITSDEETVELVNPYSGAKDTYKYSKGACWYREMTRLSLERYNCSVWPIPLPWEYRNIRSCFNIDNASKSDFTYHPAVISTDVYNGRVEISNAARIRCENRKSCKSRDYSFQYSLSSWPSDLWLGQVLERIVDTNITRGPNYVPGVRYLLANSTKEQAKASLLQIRLSSDELRSSQSQLSVSYNFNSLVADVGGFFGLFLGASFLSMLELVELLHNLVLVVCPMKKKNATQAADEQQTSAMEGCVAKTC